jgi:hypothetical protein
MRRVLPFLNDYVIPIYILLFFSFVFAVRKYIISNHEKTEAVFGLEIELAKRHRVSATAFLISICFVAILEFLLVFILVPAKPELLTFFAPTRDFDSFPASTIPSDIISTIIAKTPGATQTNASSTCIPGIIMIANPKVGDQIRGNISIIGTADVPNFGFYKYEFSLVGTDSWTTIQAGREIKIESKLGDWDTSEMTPGDYLLRLVVFDNQGQIYPTCVIPVRILQP